jgi:pimeloyl-ACP methyl ester carboxylesterase
LGFARERFGESGRLAVKAFCAGGWGLGRAWCRGCGGRESFGRAPQARPGERLDGVEGSAGRSCDGRWRRASHLRERRAGHRRPPRVYGAVMGDAPADDAFAVEHAEVRDGVGIGYVRAGAGGYPLLLVHGWPETKRIWWRNIGPLADAGFEVIAPDLRGFGDSDLAPDGFYDLAAHARDMHALVSDVLGHDRCAAAGGDLGGGVVQDLGLRFEGFVERQVLFNCVLPLLGARYEAAGIASEPSREVRMAADYFVRQGREADALAEELGTAQQRRRYVAEFYGHRFWAAPGGFSRDEVDFMTEPFADAQRLRAGWGNYESALGTRALSETPRFFEVSDVPTLALYGPDDHVIWRQFPQMCEVAFSELIGPYVVPGAGHFLQWERAGLFNRTIEYFLRDLPGSR